MALLLNDTCGGFVIRTAIFLNLLFSSAQLYSFPYEIYYVPLPALYQDLDEASTRIGAEQVCLQGAIDNAALSVSTPSVNGDQTSRVLAPLDHVLDERQAEAEAAVPFGARCVGLSEAVKDIWQEISTDAFARVAHSDANVWVYALKASFDAASPRRELDRVGEQVPDHLLQAGGVAGDLPNFGG